VPDVLSPELLAELRDYFDEIEARLTAGEEIEHCFRSEHGDVQINHLPMKRPNFRQLLAPPKAFPLVRRAMHAKYGEEPTFLDMADGFVCHDDHGQRWHQDGEYVRLTFALDDIDPVTGGGTGFMPATHRDGPLVGPAVPMPDWANTVADSGVDVGVNLEGSTQMFGKAGCCAVNYTTIWHRRVPNLGNQKRRIIWSVYKRASQRFGEAHKNSPSVDDPAIGHTKEVFLDFGLSFPPGSLERSLVIAPASAEGEGKLDWAKAAERAARPLASL